jgi:two-component system NtrC family response regulator
MGRVGILLSSSALKTLQAQSWPGNVHQLTEVIERLVAFSPEGVVTKKGVLSVLAECSGSVEALRRLALQRQQDELIAFLDATGGNIAETARRMNMSRGAIIYRAQKFGLLGRRIQINSASRRPRTAGDS